MSTKETGIFLSAVEIAALIGKEPYDLQLMHTEDFGVPGHWFLNKQGKVIYTEHGTTCMVELLTKAGEIKAAADLHTKLVEQRQLQATPSRALIPPGEKGAQPYYRTHPTLS